MCNNHSTNISTWSRRWLARYGVRETLHFIGQQSNF